MKSRLLLILALVLLVASPCFADSSAELSADAAVYDGAGCLQGIVVQTDGTNAVTFAIYDNATAASGADIVPELVITSSSTDRVQYLNLSSSPCMARFYNGIYVDITTAGTCKYMVYYLPGR